MKYKRCFCVLSGCKLQAIGAIVKYDNQYRYCRISKIKMNKRKYCRQLSIVLGYYR